MVSSQKQRPWEEIALEEQGRRDAAIPSEWKLKSPISPSVRDVMSVPYESGIMTPQELALTEKDATELLALLAGGKLKSYDLTLAFCKRAALAQQVVRVTVSIFEGKVCSPTCSLIASPMFSSQRVSSGPRSWTKSTRRLANLSALGTGCHFRPKTTSISKGKILLPDILPG